MIGDWITLPVGIVIATLASMVGLGGGVLWMPYLIFVVRLDPATAVMTSLVIQIVGMGSGAFTALRHKRADPVIALMIVAAAFPGVVFGYWLKGMVNERAIVFLVGAACMASALVFVVVREQYDFAPVRTVSPRAVLPYLWVPPLLSVLTGLLSVGVGDFLVPVLRNRLRMKMATAIGVCLVVMCVNAAAAAGVHALGGNHFAPGLAAYGAVGALVGGQIGPRIAHRIADQTLKEIFIYGLSLVGIHVLFNA